MHLRVCASIPNVDGNGDPILNRFGMQTYTDVLQSEIILTSNEDILRYINNGLFSQIMESAEAEVERCKQAGTLPMEPVRRF